MLGRSRLHHQKPTEQIVFERWSISAEVRGLMTRESTKLFKYQVQPCINHGANTAPRGRNSESEEEPRLSGAALELPLNLAIS